MVARVPMPCRMNSALAVQNRPAPVRVLADGGRLRKASIEFIRCVGLSRGNKWLTAASIPCGILVTESVLESLLMTLILASNSPRRKQLLALGGWEFSIAPAEVDERPLPAEAAADYVLRLAQDKALAAARNGANGLVLAADTTVVDDGAILGKPRNAAEALAMLRQLRGRTHQVYTALALLRPARSRPASTTQSGTSVNRTISAWLTRALTPVDTNTGSANQTTSNA